MKNVRFLSVLTAIVLIFTIAVNEADAKWPDNSDELPGMVSDGEMLLIAGGGILLIGGLVTLLVIKKKQDKKLESALYNFPGYESLELITSSNTDDKDFASLFNKLNKATENASVLLFARGNNIPGQNYNLKQGLSVGVRITF